MKDKQIAQASIEPRIFLVSGLLHCVSMTGLVFLRRSFGFDYLRPKSVFFAFSWAFCVYSIYAWMADGVWQGQRHILLFGGTAMLLYWCHLLIAFVREWNQNGEHDQYSGNSHAYWLLQKVGGKSSPNLEATLHLWGEPGVLLLAAVAVKITLDVSLLSQWLGIAAACLWCKEALNHWYSIRQNKRRTDSFDDTAETMELPTTSNLPPKLSKATRKTKVKRSRITGF